MLQALEQHGMCSGFPFPDDVRQKVEAHKAAQEQRQQGVDTGREEGQRDGPVSMRLDGGAGHRGGEGLLPGMRRLHKQSQRVVADSDDDEQPTAGARGRGQEEEQQEPRPMQQPGSQQGAGPNPAAHRFLDAGGRGWGSDGEEEAGSGPDSFINDDATDSDSASSSGSEGGDGGSGQPQRLAGRGGKGGRGTPRGGTGERPSVDLSGLKTKRQRVGSSPGAGDLAAGDLAASPPSAINLLSESEPQQQDGLLQQPSLCPPSPHQQQQAGRAVRHSELRQPSLGSGEGRMHAAPQQQQEQTQQNQQDEDGEGEQGGDEGPCRPLTKAQQRELKALQPFGWDK